MGKMWTQNKDVFPTAENAFKIFTWHMFTEGSDVPEYY